MGKKLKLRIPICILLVALLVLFIFVDRLYTQTVTITIPPCYQESFHFTDTAFTTVGKQIHILGGQDLGDSMVVLQPVTVRQESTYEPTYITPGLEVQVDVEKGAIFRIGVLESNISNTNQQVELSISGIKLCESQ